MAITWPDRADEAIAGDLTAALAYVTPAGGAVVTAVAPIGLRDRDAGHGHRSRPRSASARSSSGSRATRACRSPTTRASTASPSRPTSCWCRATRRPSTEPSREYLENTLRPAGGALHGPAEGGQALLGPVAARVLPGPRARGGRRRARERRGATCDCAGAGGGARCARAPASRPPQAEPKNGTGPRVDAERAARRLRGLDHVLLAYVGGGRLPGDRAGHDRRRRPGRHPALVARRAAARRPPRRAASGHSYRAKLIGLAARQHTGWLTVDEEGALYAPHTESGFRAPPNKTLLLFFNGLLAKQGLRRARAQAGREPSATASALHAEGRGVAAQAPAREPRRAEEPGAAEYASLNAVYAVALAGLMVGTRSRDEDVRAVLGTELIPLTAATFAVSKMIARERIGSWVREPFVDDPVGPQAPARRERAARARRARHVQPLRRARGPRSASSGCASRTPAPAAPSTAVFAVAGFNDFAQAAFRGLCDWSNAQRLAPAVPR